MKLLNKAKRKQGVAFKGGNVFFEIGENDISQETLKILREDKKENKVFKFFIDTKVFIILDEIEEAPKSETKAERKLREKQESESKQADEKQDFLNEEVKKE
jgi:hypothetical protein